jgi:hypothetical protein
VSVADALLLRLTVELRNAGLAFVDFLKRAVTLACVAVLVALGARLTPFFHSSDRRWPGDAGGDTAAGGLGRVRAAALRPHGAAGLLTKAPPLAAALVLGQVYFRLIILFMSLVSSPKQTGYYGGRCARWKHW